MFELRDYQERFVAQILAAWLLFRVVLAVLPTGGGKTICFAAIMHDHVGASAAVVHRKEILGQISMALARLGVRHRVIAPSKVLRRIRRKHLKEFGRSFVDPHALVGVVSVQTLTSRSANDDRELQRWVAQITLAVFDEGHHYVRSGLWGRAVELMARAKILFVTATPERADGTGLGKDAGGYAEVMVEGPPLQWLIDEGYASPFDYRAPKSDFDASGIPLTASGELNTKELRKRVVESHLVGDIVEHYSNFTPGSRAIVFAVDVETAEDIAEAFRRRGITAVALSGDTESGERDDAVDDFEAGRLPVLVNCDLFDEGFDVPGVDTVIMGRKSESLGKVRQQAGRALRPVYAKGYDLSTREGRRAAIAAGPKPRATIIDPVRNWERHGLPNWPQPWTLDGSSRGSRGSSGMVLQYVCEGCTQPYPRFEVKCPYCGDPVPVPAGRSAPEMVDGDMVLLDVEAMTAIFKAMQRADMLDEDYQRDQLARNVPPIGRGADLKRHQADKYRRTVLRELVAWWFGMQPAERSLSEKQRRFFYRFGVDIGTAFTLKADATDALIERIKQRFAEDMAA